MADAHHDAAERDQRGGREADLLGPEQRGDHDVAPRAHPAVGLQDDPPAQPVAHERLLRLGEPELPRDARVLDRGLRRGARAAVVPGITMWSACAFTTPAATVPTPSSEVSLTEIRALGLAQRRS